MHAHLQRAAAGPALSHRCSSCSALPDRRPRLFLERGYPAAAGAWCGHSALLCCVLTDSWDRPQAGRGAGAASSLTGFPTGPRGIPSCDTLPRASHGAKLGCPPASLAHRELKPYSQDVLAGALVLSDRGTQPAPHCIPLALAGHLHSEHWVPHNMLLSHCFHHSCMMAESLLRTTGYPYSPPVP